MSKICIVAPEIYGLFNPQARTSYSDGDMQLYELARYFGKDERIDTTVVTGDFDQEDVEYYSGVLVFRSSFNTNTRFWQRWLRQSSEFHTLLSEINANVYMMAGASELAQPVAEFCKRQKKAFLFRVAHQRDCDGTYIHSAGEVGEQYKWALQQAKLILCQTGEQQSMLRRTTRLQGYVLHNGAPIEPPSDEIREDALWIGEAVEWKQPERFLRLALTVPSQFFTMIAYPRNPEYFEKLVEKTRDIPNLGFNNSVPYHELPRFLQRAKLLVNTSRFEGFPYAFSLALRSGVPIASLHVDPDGLLTKQQIGVCAEGSEVRLAQDVSDLVTYERQRKRYQDNAAQFALAYQNIDTIAQEYRKLFLKFSATALRRRRQQKQKKLE